MQMLISSWVLRHSTTNLQSVVASLLLSDLGVLESRFIFVRVRAHKTLNADENTLEALCSAPLLALNRVSRGLKGHGTMPRTFSPRHVPGYRLEKLQIRKVRV